MNYLFFDIECANCDNGIGKICSFGYVLCDNKFNILEKNDILVNPNAKFSYGVFSKKFITLAYPQSEFICQPKFDILYPQIRDIIMRPDQIIIGHAVDNDVNFILGECERYSKPIFMYDFYDSQELYRVITNSTMHKKLGDICVELDIEMKNAHQSDDDAEMTMLVTKALCENQQLSLPELLEKYPTSQHKMNNLIIKHNLRKQFHLFKQFINNSEKEKTIINENIKGFTFCFSRKIEMMDYSKIASIIQLILDCGGKYTCYVEKANYFVRGKGGCDRLTKAVLNNNVHIISFPTMCKLLDINYSKTVGLNLSKYLLNHSKIINN
jgi:DNA polymerase III epsilon subunit-like protein